MLVCVAVAPLLGLLILGSIVDRDVALGNARAKAMQLATLGAEKQADVLEDATSVLKTLRRLPGQALGQDGTCQALLRAIVADRPQFNTIGIVDPDASLRCHSMVSDRKSFADLDLLNSVMRPDAPLISVGRLRSGKVSGKPVVTLASPLPSAPDGPSPGMVFIGLQLSSFGRVASELRAGDDRTVLVVDPRSGTVLARAPDPGTLVGRSFPDQPLIQAIVASPHGGAIDAEGLDGDARIFGFVPLPGALEGGPVLVIGLSRAAVLAEANARLRIGIVVALAASGIALLGATIFGRALLDVPIRALCDVAERLRHGDLSARARIAPWQAPELRMLASALGDMAEGVARAQDALSSSEAELRLLAENSTDMIFKLDPQLRQVYVSPSAREVLGHDPDDIVGVKPISMIHPEDTDQVSETLRDLIDGQDRGSIVHRIRHQDGRWLWVEANMRVLRDRRSGLPTGILGSLRDISRRKSAEIELEAVNQRLKAWAHQDALTGLANRRCFDETLLREWRRAQRDGWPLGLIMIDVDAFKSYNDGNGHQMGDQCLQAVAGTIRQCLRRSSDIAARYGGEEFVVILPDTPEAGCLVIAERIRASMEALAIPHPPSPSGYVTLSAGVAWVDPGSRVLDAAAMVSLADRNLYAAKVGGRNRVVAGEPPPLKLHDSPTMLSARLAVG